MTEVKRECVGWIYVEMVRSGWHTWPSNTGTLLLHFYLMISVQVMSLNWHCPVLFQIPICQLQNINRKHEHYGLQIHPTELYRVWWLQLVISRFIESDLAPTRDRKGLLSLLLACVVFTPLSRIIPAWNRKKTKLHVKKYETPTDMTQIKHPLHSGTCSTGLALHRPFPDTCCAPGARHEVLISSRAFGFRSAAAALIYVISLSEYPANVCGCDSVCGRFNKAAY